MAWMGNYTLMFYVDVIIYPCHKPETGLVIPLSNRRTWLRDDSLSSMSLFANDTPSYAYRNTQSVLQKQMFQMMPLKKL